jgi:RepB DNA-primase N-terminal domain
MASRCSQVSVIRPKIEVDHVPPRSVRRKRAKKSAIAVRHLCPNLAGDGAIRLAALRASSALPTQITLSSTSPGIHRYIWRVHWFPIEPKGNLGKPLATAVGSHPTCTECNWVLRLMGFENCKNDPAYHVTVEYRGDFTWDSDNFRLDILASDAILSSRTFTARKHPDNPTNPEHDWLWTLHEFTRGKDAAKLTRKLTSRRVDKRNSLYHSPRTADVASARLRLGESIPIDDAVILLEGRRSLEISLVLCRARAREAKSLCAGREGIIPDSISCRSKNGASHRKNCDTPPLGGNCRETCERSRGTILASDRRRIPGFREETCVCLRKTRVSGGRSDGAAR